MFRRRFDRFHCILLALCALMSMLIIQSLTPRDGIISKALLEYESFGSQQTAHHILGANNKSLVYHDPTTPLIWIGGVPRSGTTLMRSMLDAHPDIRCGEETRVVPRILGLHSKMYAEPKEMSRLIEAHINEELLNSALASYILTVIAGHGETAPMLCNKDPFAIRSMKLILKMFPNSKFILMIRDGRAVAHSILSRHVTIKGFDLKTYDGSIKNWNQAMGTMLRECYRAGTDRCLPVYYERLVINPEQQMRRILDFLNIPWDDIVLHHEKTIGMSGGISLSKKEPSTNQVNKAVNTDALLNWHGNIPSSVLANINQLAPLLEKLGYPVGQGRPNYGRDLRAVLETSWVV